ncbi:hypothetical protein AB0B12_04695 [Streptomyces sp. NPDC044780]|uniref:hypothetical protein n=1 Tax=unclassified Streptomyces TaxID=2593676 RepID=UPI0034108037
MGLRQLLIDTWSWLNYKPVMADVGRPGNRSFPELAASWLPPDELRRLAAYKVLSAYDNNQAGQLAAAAGDEAGIERRELGDAAKLVDTALGYLLGSEQKIAVEGAEHADGEAPKPGATEAAAGEVWTNNRRDGGIDQHPIQAEKLMELGADFARLSAQVTDWYRHHLDGHPRRESRRPPPP